MSDMRKMLKSLEDKLAAALAQICAGQQSQDEVICALERRIQKLEAERAAPHQN